MNKLKQAARSSSLEDIEATIKASKLQTPTVGMDSHALQMTGKAIENNTPTSAEDEEIPGINDDNLVAQDFIEVRKNLKDLIKKGNEAVNKVVNNINEESYPKHVETLADLIRTLVGANKELMGVHLTKKDISGPKGNSNPGNGEPKGNQKVPLTSAKLDEMVTNILNDKVKGLNGGS